MFLKQLSLLNYKNLAQIDFEFDAKINCFVGKNGVGKTNILDAIYHLAYGKSYFNPLAIQNIKHGEEFFVIDATLEKNNKEEKIVCSLKKGQKKTIKRNGKIYDKLSEHLGLIPLVIISPSDADLIVEGSETRRKFIDSVIATLDNSYLQLLINYQKTLAQRNALLKYFALNQTFEKQHKQVLSFADLQNGLETLLLDFFYCFGFISVTLNKKTVKTSTASRTFVGLFFVLEAAQMTCMKACESAYTHSVFLSV